MNTLAFWAIFIIPVLWGIGFPLTHNAVRVVNPGEFAFYRQLIAASCLFPFACRYFNQLNMKTLAYALLIGAWSTLSMTAQSFALSHTSSAMTAFFVTLNILFVPFLLLIFKQASLKMTDVIAVLLGLISILVTFNGSLNQFNAGDLFGLLAAFAIAMNIVTIQFVTRQGPINRILLTFLSMFVGVIFLAYFPLTSFGHFEFNRPSIWGALLYQGCISTALAYLLQVMYQKQVGETRTSIILNLDLFFASLFGLLNGEWLTLSQIIGGVIALAASIYQDAMPLFKKIYFYFKKLFQYRKQTSIDEQCS